MTRTPQLLGKLRADSLLKQQQHAIVVMTQTPLQHPIKKQIEQNSELCAQRCSIRAFRCRAWQPVHSTAFPSASPHLSHSCMSWSVHLGLATSLGNLHQTDPINLRRCIAIARNRNDNCSVALDLKLVTLEMRVIHNSHALNHPVSRIVLMPPLCLSVRFDQILLDRCFRPCMCLSSDMFRRLESQM